MSDDAKGVAIYARVSSDKQDIDLSISAQLRALREYAEKNNQTIVREFVDEAESGRSIDRPGFREMIALARLKPAPFEAILVWKLSRFARNREDSIIYKSLLRKHGVQVISINEPVEDTPTGRLLEGIIESIDEFYSANLAQDVIRGLRENANRGYFNGSRASFGYVRIKVKDGETDRTTLQPDPEKVLVVQRIFRECSQGKGLKEIAKGLNRDGIPSPAGGKWGKQRIHKILTNETYTGCLVWGKKHKGTASLPLVRKEGAWPALIEKDMFQRVQNMLNSHAPKVTHPRVTSSSYLLSGLIRCQKCGAAYIGYGAKSGRHHYYVCGTTYAKGKEVCPSQHLPKDNIEQFVVEKIKGYILTDEHLTKLVEIVNEELDGSINDYKDQIKVIDGQLDDWQGRLERLYDFVETKEIEPTRMAKRVIQVQDKIEELRKTKLDIQGSLLAHRQEPLEPSIVLQYVKELQCLLEESDICERRAFLRSFIESIQVDDGTITLNYTVPLPPDSSRQETVSVLGIVPTGPPKNEAKIAFLTPVLSILFNVS